jgi:hypothetical protein
MDSFGHCQCRTANHWLLFAIPSVSDDKSQFLLPNKGSSKAARAKDVETAHQDLGRGHEQAALHPGQRDSRPLARA